MVGLEDANKSHFSGVVFNRRGFIYCTLNYGCMILDFMVLVVG